MEFWRFLQQVRGVLLACLIRDVIVVLDHLGDHKVEPLFGELRVEVSLFSKTPQPSDLPGLAGRIRGRHVVRRLQFTHLLRAAEPLSKHVDKRGIDVVDARTQTVEALLRILLGTHEYTP